MNNSIRSTLRYYIDVLFVLIYKEWIVKYKGTLLGYVWSIAHPLVLSIVFYIAFKIALKIPIENYTLFLITGLFAWQWFMNSVMVSVWSFVANASIIKKTTFPKFLLPLSINILDMIHFIISIPVIIVFLAIYHQKVFYFSWFYEIPLVLFLQLILGFSVGLIFGTLNVFVRDIDRLASLLLTLVMYLTPIFYKIQMVPQEYRSYFYLNPMVHVIDLWRDIFMRGTINSFNLIWGSIDILIFLAISIAIYKKLHYKFAEYL
ncbi:ABC transporter permease [Persephonella sp.]|uniref:ABC transporter permease n=1 Tax=Persephonella sp. TaxID=2060922 RepID=UPI00262FF070|nr:ABC transporter permease [Persephonella sp.]